MLPSGAGFYGGSASAFSAETIAWENGIIALGASVTSGEKTLADNLIKAIEGASYGFKILYLLPYIGGTIKAARMPLRDTFGVGAAANVGFVDGDVGTGVGIDNSAEAAKYLDSLITPQGLGVNGSAATLGYGGLGHYERNFGAGTHVEPMGCYNAANTARYCLDLRTTFERLRFGTTANAGGSSSTTTSAHYYGQSQATGTPTLVMSKNGSHLNTDFSGSTAYTGPNDESIIIMGCNEAGTFTPWKGRSACNYLTDGTMSSGDITAFHALLGTLLITPTGR